MVVKIHYPKLVGKLLISWTYSEMYCINNFSLAYRKFIPLITRAYCSKFAETHYFDYLIYKGHFLRHLDL